MTKNMESINFIQQTICYDFRSNLFICKLFWCHSHKDAKYGAKIKIAPHLISTDILPAWKDKVILALSRYIKLRYNIEIFYAN